MHGLAGVKGVALLAITLAAGIGLGIVYDRRRAPTHQAPDAHHLVDRLSVALALDSAQQEAIAAIFARRQRAVDSAWHALQPRVRATMDSTLREILPILRPDQAAKYRTMIAEMHPGALP